MEPGIYLVLHLLILGLPPLIMAALLKGEKTVIFHSYFGFLFVLTQLFAVVYTIEPIEGIPITGGNIAYSSLMLVTYFIMITTRDAASIRTIMIIQVILNLFLYFLYGLVSVVLNDPGTVNILGITPKLFETTIFINLSSSITFIIEVLLVFWMLERTKFHARNLLAGALIVVLSFIGILCIDGILFPGLVGLFLGNFGSLVVGTVLGKLVLGLGYTPFMVAFLFIQREEFKHFLDTPIDVKGFILPSREELFRKLEKTREELNVARNDYKSAYKQAIFLKDLLLHNFSNILQGISLLNEMATMVEGDVERLRKINEKMAQQVESASLLIETVRNLFQLQPGGLMAQEPVDVQVLLRETVKHFKETVSGDVKINLVSSPGSLVVKANYWLREIIINILDNA